MAVQLRSRDQVWQLLLAIGGSAAVLVIAGMMAFGGSGGETAAVGLTVPPAEDGGLIAGPSDGNNREGQRSQRRSVGPIDGAGSEPSTADDSRPPISVETSSMTVGPVTEPSTTNTAVSTTTTAPPSTSTFETTIQRPTTIEPTTTQPTTTEPPVAEPSTSRPKPVPPTATIGPIESLPPVGKDHSITPKDLSKARKQWRSLGYDSYGMTVSRVCFCPNAGPLAVVVRNGDVQSAKPPTGDGETGRDLDRSSLTVPGLFDLIESGFEADGMRVVFDKSTGVPLTIEIDYARRAIDDELTVIVGDFQPHRSR